MTFDLAFVVQGPYLESKHPSDMVTAYMNMIYDIFEHFRTPVASE
jgi:hypothetical protein